MDAGGQGHIYPEIREWTVVDLQQRSGVIRFCLKRGRVWKTAR